MEHLEGARRDIHWMWHRSTYVHAIQQTVTRSQYTLPAHARTHALPGSIGQLEDDVIGQVVHFPQPEVVGDVVAVHERLKATTAGAHQLHTVSEN